MRILLVPPVVWLLLKEDFAMALWLFFIAGVSDGLDGFLAKQFCWTSRLGEFLDPLADKLLLVFSMLALGKLGLLPAWLIAIVLLRDVTIVAGALFYHFKVSRFDAEPSVISKLNTFSQILLVLLVIANQLIPIDFSNPILALIFLVTLTIFLSGVDYVITWGKRARNFNSSGGK